MTVKPLKEVYIDVQRQPDEKLKVPMQRVFHSDMVRWWRERERERECQTTPWMIALEVFILIRQVQLENEIDLMSSLR